MPAPVANDTRQSQDSTVKKGLRRPRLSAIILSSRPRALILIAAPFSSRLSRYRKIPAKIDLELIKVQTGSYLGEDDIVRIEDDYQRS